MANIFVIQTSMLIMDTGIVAGVEIRDFFVAGHFSKNLLAFFFYVILCGGSLDWLKQAFPLFILPLDHSEFHDFSEAKNEIKNSFVPSFRNIFLPFYKIFQRDQKMNSFVLTSFPSKKVCNCTSSKTALNRIILINLLPYNYSFYRKIIILLTYKDSNSSGRQTKRFIF